MSVVAYDFDGTLVDSYSCLPEVYRELARLIGLTGGEGELFAKALLLLEDAADFLGVSSKAKLWGSLLPGLPGGRASITLLVDRYWSLRAAGTRVFNEAVEALGFLNQSGVRVYLVSGSDEDAESKIDRVRRSGLMGYFEEALVYGEGSVLKTLRDALRALRLRSRGSTIYYVDDKPLNLRRVGGVEGVRLVNYVYKPPLPVALSWSVNPPESSIRIRSHLEILRLLAGNGAPAKP